MSVCATRDVSPGERIGLRRALVRQGEGAGAAPWRSRA